MDAQEHQEQLEQQDMELEDILKEFSNSGEEEAPQEDLPALADMEEFLSEQHPEGITDDTIRLELSNLKQQVAKLSDTVRLDSLAEVVSQEETAAPAQDGEPVEAGEPLPEAPAVEPYSPQWEPEYEQPIGEYIPPKPILFHPKSRLRELKRKLIAGPERRYYELSELGTGRLQCAIFLSFLVFAVTAGVTAFYTMGHISPERLKLVVFSQFLSLLLAALLGHRELLGGIADAFRLRFSLNSTLIFTLTACLIDGLFCLREQRVPCCAPFSLQVMMALWADYHRRTTEKRQMDTMRKATHLDSLLAHPEYYEGTAGILRGEGQVEDFMDTYRQRSTAEKILSCYGLCAVIVSVGAGITGYFLHNDLSFAMRVAAASLLAGIPVTSFIAYTRPYALLERKLHAVGAVLCGWQGICGLSGKKVFPITHDDLFPAGYCNLNGVKFYGDRDPDEIVAYAAALISASGGGLVPLFDYLLESRNGKHYTVSRLQAYHGGIGGEIFEESVLIGTPGFLRDLGVEIPQGTRVNQAVYMAIDGELCGLFAITFEKEKTAAAAFGTLCAYRRMRPVLVSNDFLLTESFLRSRFGIHPRRILLPELPTRQKLSEKKPESEDALALITGRGLAPFVYAAAGARGLKTAAALGVIIHMIGGILGLVMMLLLAILGAEELLTPGNMLLYELVWLVPGFLITEWTRSV